MFNFFKKKEVKAATKNFVAPVDGKCVKLDGVSDPLFSSKAMGDGYAVVPTSNTVCAPADGEILMIFPTGHAFGMKTDDGVEILVHIGVDTVNLSGKGFSQIAKKGAVVHAGDPIVKVDFDAVKEAGYDTVTMTIFTGGYEAEIVTDKFDTDVKAGDVVIARD